MNIFKALSIVYGFVKHFSVLVFSYIVLGNWLFFFAERKRFLPLNYGGGVCTFLKDSTFPVYVNRVPINRPLSPWTWLIQPNGPTRSEEEAVQIAPIGGKCCEENIDRLLIANHYHLVVVMYHDVMLESEILGNCGV